MTAKADKAALEAARGRVLALEVKDAAQGILADPSDLMAHVAAADLVADDGEPDPEKMATAARASVERKPHLATRTPAGDVDQGVRGRPAETFDFPAMPSRPQVKPLAQFTVLESIAWSRRYGRSADVALRASYRR